MRDPQEVNVNTLPPGMVNNNGIVNRMENTMGALWVFIFAFSLLITITRRLRGSDCLSVPSTIIVLDKK
jgi:hypothetical protein